MYFAVERSPRHTSQEMKLSGWKGIKSISGDMEERQRTKGVSLDVRKKDL